MRIAVIFRILGIFLMLFSLTIIPPLGVDAWYQENLSMPFLLVMGITALTGLLLWYPCRNIRQELKTRDGFIVVVVFWVTLSLYGCLPFLVVESSHSFTDAFFESVSGLTTTGVEVFNNLETLPHSILYYHQQLQFLGGMGIIVLAIAIFPMLGVGGMQLYRAEMPGPIKDTKLTPRITETAKALWYIYVGLTICCALAYYAAGLSPFEAICESFSTVATGGFSIHQNSFAYYNNKAVDLIAVLFIILSATNYGLHFLALQQRSLNCYRKDHEFRAYLVIIAFVTTIIIALLYSHNVYPDFETTVIKALFTVVSLGSTTGLTNTDFANWPTFGPYLIMLTALIGGCASSTTGGVKVLRVLLLQKEGMRELKRLIHPKSILIIKFSDQILSEKVIQAMWAFVSIFIVSFITLFLLLMATGLDIVTSFGAVAACLANTGASIGQVSVDFESINLAAKWILIFAMFAGRLEIFTLLVLFMPSFWRR